jgi:hypothetical protein
MKIRLVIITAPHLSDEVCSSIKQAQSCTPAVSVWYYKWGRLNPNPFQRRSPKLALPGAPHHVRRTKVITPSQQSRQINGPIRNKQQPTNAPPKYYRTTHTSLLPPPKTNCVTTFVPHPNHPLVQPIALLYHPT